MLLLNRTAKMLMDQFGYFNTSYVVIKRFFKDTGRCIWYISIHLMLLLNLVRGQSTCEIIDFNTSYVVIKLTKSKRNWWKYIISIHLMLLLNVISKLKCTVFMNISIHLMLLLNIIDPIYKVITGEFQYILCCY